MLIDFIKSLYQQTIARFCGAAGAALTLVSPALPERYGGIWPGIVTASLCFVTAFYAVWAAERREVATLNGRVRELTGSVNGSLNIRFLPGVRRYEEEVGRPYGSTARTVSVAVENVGGRTVDGCRLYAESVEPDEGLAPDLQMHSLPFTSLNPGDRVFVPVATYVEPERNHAGDTTGSLHIPFRDDRDEATSNKANERTFSAKTGCVVTFRATGNGSRSCTRRFRVSVSQDRLRMDAIPL